VFFKDSFTNLYIEHYLVFSAFTSRLTSLQEFNRASAFLYMAFMFLSNKRTLSAETWSWYIWFNPKSSWLSWIFLLECCTKIRYSEVCKVHHSDTHASENYSIVNKTAICHWYGNATAFSPQVLVRYNVQVKEYTNISYIDQNELPSYNTAFMSLIFAYSYIRHQYKLKKFTVPF
jgi:hypothetical protein